MEKNSSLDSSIFLRKDGKFEEEIKLNMKLEDLLMIYFTKKNWSSYRLLLVRFENINLVL